KWPSLIPACIPMSEYKQNKSRLFFPRNQIERIGNKSTKKDDIVNQLSVTTIPEISIKRFR
ncbi:MAG: hypothetical protein Q8867_10025, partial [Bacteroidota bacterium]|nr:hypothetical protein [Bacteroidota bacterium]